MPTEMTAPPPPVVPPPPPPAFTPPKSTYRSARQKELDEIRHRGLAKIFNKHFSTVASKIREERDAADQALAELERRKAELAANPKSFSNGLTLTQLDKLYMELKRRKSDVSRKERETQELYRRYVSQYGGDEFKSKKPFNKNGMTTKEHCHNDILWQRDLMLAKSLEKGQATKDSDVGKLAGNLGNSNDAQGEILISPCSLQKPSSDMTTVFSSSQLPRTPDAKAPIADYPSSSSIKKFTPIASPTPTTDTSADSSSLPDASPQVNQTLITKLESSDTNNLKSPQGDTTSVYTKSPFGGVMVTAKVKYSQHEEDCGDSESTMSGLTTIDDATVIEAEWRLTEFLKVETDNIRKVFSLEDEVADGDSNCYDLNSHSSAAVGEVSQAAKEAEEMARQMHEATAWMKDPTLLDSDSDEENDGKEEAKPNHPWRCFWSEEHDREYYHNTETGQTCWTKPEGVTIDFSPMNKAKGASATVDKENDDQETVVTMNQEYDADSVTVKDYTKSRRVLVESQVVSLPDYTNEEMIDVFRPDNDSRSVSSKASLKHSSKVLHYRRKRAKMRKLKRRLCVALVFFIISSVLLYYYRDEWMPIVKKRFFKKHTEIDKGDEEKQDQLMRKEAEEKERIGLDAENHLRKEIDDQERIRLEAEERMRNEAEEKERIGQEAEERLREEVEGKERIRQEEERLRKEAEEKERIRQETEEKARIRIEEEEMRKEAEEEKNLKEAARLAEEMRRPPACAIPFAYIPSKKCRMLALKNPLYDCQALTDRMME